MYVLLYNTSFHPSGSKGSKKKLFSFLLARSPVLALDNASVWGLALGRTSVTHTAALLSNNC